MEFIVFYRHFARGRVEEILKYEHSLISNAQDICGTILYGRGNNVGTVGLFGLITGHLVKFEQISIDLVVVKDKEV